MDNIFTYLKCLTLFLATTHLLTACKRGETAGLTDISNENNIETMLDDGAWCWFSDPRAIYHQGKYEKIYFGAVNSRGDVLIGSKNLQSDDLQYHTLHDSLEIDDHNVPSILVLPSGKILAFYNEHNGNLYLRRSIAVEDISNWEPAQIIARKSDQYNFTYTNPVQLAQEGGRLYLFTRMVGPTRSFEHWWPSYMISEDSGYTWTEARKLLDNEGRNSPPYLKISSDGQGRIDFLFSDGHPKISSDVSVYHMYYENNSFYQTSGAVIGSMEELPIAITQVNKIYDGTQSQVRSWIWDISSEGGNPTVTYAVYPSEHDHIYYHSTWQDGHWHHHEIVNSGSYITLLRQGEVVREAHYSGGLVINPANHNQVFLARNAEGKFEVESRTQGSNGQWRRRWITKNSSKNNIRPYVVSGALPGKTYLMWLQGHYYHYTQYDMSIKMLIIN